MAIHIVTDSTSDLTPALQAQLGVSVHVVPLTVHFGEEEYQDGVDLDAPGFYAKLRSSEAMPRTSQPSPAAFIDLYQKISSPGDVILSYHISSRMSGTHQSAMLAARQVGERRIEVIDTRSVSLGLGLIAATAALDAREGKGADEILAHSRELIGKVRILFVVDTLEYLQRNGRIGKAQALVGGLLSLKPLLSVEEGVVAPVEKVRGKAKAVARLVERAAEYAGRVTMGGVLHAAARDEAESLKSELERRLGVEKLYLAELGPTVGTHAGPGTVGVVLLVE